MKLTDEQIVKLIADAFRVGRNEGMEVGARDGYENGLRDGHDEGYTEGYDQGWDDGYAKAEEDALAAEDAAEEDEDETGFESGSDKEDYSCKCSQCTSPIRCRARFRGEEYDLGWSDGYFEAGIDLDMAENEAYMDGYLQGRDDRQNNVEDEEE